VSGGRSLGPLAAKTSRRGMANFFFLAISLGPGARRGTVGAKKTKKPCAFFSGQKRILFRSLSFATSRWPVFFIWPARQIPFPGRNPHCVFNPHLGSGIFFHPAGSGGGRGPNILGLIWGAWGPTGRANIHCSIYPRASTRSKGGNNNPKKSLKGKNKGAALRARLPFPV